MQSLPDLLPAQHLPRRGPDLKTCTMPRQPFLKQPSAHLLYQFSVPSGCGIQKVGHPVLVVLCGVLVHESAHPQQAAQHLQGKVGVLILRAPVMNPAQKPAGSCILPSTLPREGRPWLTSTCRAMTANSTGEARSRTLVLVRYSCPPAAGSDSCASRGCCGARCRGPRKPGAARPSARGPAARSRGGCPVRCCLRPGSRPAEQPCPERLQRATAELARSRCGGACWRQQPMGPHLQTGGTWRHVCSEVSIQAVL